jgi:hypothetical protein
MYVLLHFFLEFKQYCFLLCFFNVLWFNPFIMPFIYYLGSIPEDQPFKNTKPADEDEEEEEESDECYEYDCDNAPKNIP